MKHKLFRKLIDLSDRFDCWYRETFSVSPKEKALALRQEAMTMGKLDSTIGKSINIREYTK